MLRFQVVRTIHDKIELFRQTDLRSTSWIVSDLKSKFYLQTLHLESHDFLEHESVMRAQELWRRFLFHQRPDMTVASREFMQALLAERLREIPEEWAARPGAKRTLFNYVTHLVPLLNDPSALEIVKEWFQSEPECLERWGHWFIQAAYAWSYCLEKKLLAPEWMSGFLINSLPKEIIWTRKLVFDFGPDLLPGESDLFLALAQCHDVTVLSPDAEWADRFHKLLRSYDKLEALAYTISTDVSGAASVKKKTHRRFTTMLAEIKDAVATVRAWAELGHMLTDIAIVAPNMRAYWPILAHYLEEEGITANKSRCSILQTLPSVQRWLGTLRLKSGALESADIETVLYSPRLDDVIDPAPLTYDEFRILYTAVYGNEDAQRSASVYKLIREQHRDRDELISRDHFVDWSLQFWKVKLQEQVLETLLKSIYYELPGHLSLRLSQWVELTTVLCSRIEIPFREADPQGIACLDLAAAEYFRGHHIYFLGLSDECMRENTRLSILDSDVVRLSATTGYDLPFGDSDRLEFEALWLMDRHGAEVVLSFPETDFEGTIMNPSTLWLQGHPSPRTLNLPGLTRWDEIQRAPIESIAAVRGWTPEYLFEMDARLRVDLGFERLAPLEKTAEKKFVSSLSASSFEDYAECPFIFASKKVFRLSDLPTLDLDVDRLTRGKMAHALLEHLTQEPIQFEYSDVRLLEIIDSCRTKERVQLADPRLLGAFHRKYLVLARRFLAFEKQWREKFPKTRTVARELDLAGYVRESDAAFLTEVTPSEPAYGFKGQIDRIDEDQDGNIVIIDYKSTGSQLSGWSTWIKNNLLQLGIYAMAIQSGFAKELQGRRVVGLSYFVLQPLDRTKSLIVIDGASDLLPLDDRKKNKISTCDQNIFMSDLQKRLFEIISKINTGDIHPHPVDEQICTNCPWSGLCRAPHLN